jgi:quercetin 2,3-dioxygenase
MITLRKESERGKADRGWLRAAHSFSFATYYDPKNMGFGPLRVLNDDWFGPGRGFGTHPHENMEIITFPLSGSLAHADSTGGGGTLSYGDVQRMSAGDGVEHSEFNGSKDEWLHLLQIWIEPNKTDAPARYEDRRFDPEARRGKLQLLISPDGQGGSLDIYQDATLSATILTDGQRVTQPLAPGRKAYVHLATGTMIVNGHELSAGDALTLIDESEIVLEGKGEGEALLFDLP